VKEIGDLLYHPTMIRDIFYHYKEVSHFSLVVLFLDKRMTLKVVQETVHL
jgi:hypothetical protein